MPGLRYFHEEFTESERSLLAPFFTNLDGPVFGLVNLPEVVKGALFARYSRSAKSMRRLFLDEFVDQPDLGIASLAAQPGEDGQTVGLRRATQLYDRVFTEYGDDSVAQLGAAHLACEQASNLLTKVLEWGRLGSYLEQSTRYVFFDKPLGSSYRYMVPPEVDSHGLGAGYRATLDSLFETYRDLIPRLSRYYETIFPRDAGDPETAWRASIRARVCDDLRGLLPAATVSNVGIFASAQAYEALLLRMRAHPLEEVRDYGDLIHAELIKIIPAFLRRLDQPERGGRWTHYFATIQEKMKGLAETITAPVPQIAGGEAS